MYYVTKKMEISGSHYITLEKGSKCERLHGHNWIITVYCKAKELAEDGMTMLVVTHERDFARNVSSRVLFMADGRVVETGPSRDFFENPKEERSREFIRAIREARE